MKRLAYAGLFRSGNELLIILITLRRWLSEKSSQVSTAPKKMRSKYWSQMREPRP